MEFITSEKQFQETDNFRYERLLYSHGYLKVAGCDEVGRGPLAGPVVAACVVLPLECDHSIFLDSKIISHLKRVGLCKVLQDVGASIGIGLVSEKKIDQINIHNGSLLAMKRAVANLAKCEDSPDFLLIDGKFPIPHPATQQALIKGESKSSSIAAASIIAKVHRDALMVQLHNKYPFYNFAKNKGYPTLEHRNAIIAHGPCPAHRRSFKGVMDDAS